VTEKHILGALPPHANSHVKKEKVRACLRAQNTYGVLSPLYLDIKFLNTFQANTEYFNTY